MVAIGNHSCILRLVRLSRDQNPFDFVKMMKLNFSLDSSM